MLELQPRAKKPWSLSPPELKIERQRQVSIKPWHKQTCHCTGSNCWKERRIVRERVWSRRLGKVELGNGIGAERRGREGLTLSGRVNSWND